MIAQVYDRSHAAIATAGSHMTFVGVTSWDWVKRLPPKLVLRARVDNITRVHLRMRVSNARFRKDPVKCRVNSAVGGACACAIDHTLRICIHAAL